MKKETTTTKELNKKKRILSMVKDIETDNIIDYIYVLVEDAWKCEVIEQWNKREKENAETTAI